MPPIDYTTPPEQSLPELLQRVRACTLCAAHLPLGPRPVLQAGSRAKILIAGQAPGRKVHASGIPFDDASGQRLRAWLGLTPAQFYDPELVALLPMGFCYPGSGKSGDLPPRPECASTWRQPLLQRMPQIALTVVLGQYALAWHLPQLPRNITQAVENWRSTWPHTIVLPHPQPAQQRLAEKTPLDGGRAPAPAAPARSAAHCQ